MPGRAAATSAIRQRIRDAPLTRAHAPRTTLAEGLRLESAWFDAIAPRPEPSPAPAVGA
jgi:hypothetical protein